MSEELKDRFKEEAQRVGAVVVELPMAEAFHYIMELARAKGIDLVAISPSSFPEYQNLVQLLSQEGIQTVLSTETSVQRLRRALVKAGIGVSGADLGIAETGTLVLAKGGGRDRLVTALTLIHCVLLDPDRLTLNLEEAMTTLKGWNNGRPPTHISLITGPSRTADIETALIIGVHGPREVHILLSKGE